MKRAKSSMSLFILSVLVLIPLIATIKAEPAVANSPAAPDAVVIPPGGSVEIALANSLALPDAADIPLAVQMAVSDYGLIHGFGVQINVFDSGCDAGSGAIAAGAIVSNPQHAGVIGPVCSSSATGALPIFESAGLVMISATTTAIGLEGFGPNVFNRTVIPDPEFAGWDQIIDQLPLVIAWEALFNTTFGHAPWQHAKYAYDTAILLLTRLDQVGVVDGGGNLVIDLAELASAVRTTSAFNAITSNIALDVYGTRIDQSQTAVWTDPFTLPGLSAGWSWINEDPSHWSLTAHPGFLRIITQTPAQNRLIMAAPNGDYEIRTRVLFEPTENFQFAGISVYLDGDNYMNLGRAYCNIGPPACLDNAIYFDFIEGGALVPPNYVMTTTLQTEAYVRIVKAGSDFTGYVSTNGTSWQVVGTHTAAFSPAYVGLYASGQSSATEIPADYDFFVLESGAIKAFLPVTSR